MAPLLVAMVGWGCSAAAAESCGVLHTPLRAEAHLACAAAEAPLLLEDDQHYFGAGGWVELGWSGGGI